MNVYELLKNLGTKKIIIYGTGLFALSLHKLLPHSATCFIDDDPAKQGQKVDGILTYGIGMLQKNAPDFFIIVTVNYFHIKKRLESCGLTEGEHFCDAASFFRSFDVAEPSKGFIHYVTREIDRAYLRWKFRLDTAPEALLGWIGYCIKKYDSRLMEWYESRRKSRMLKYFRQGCFQFKDICLPDVRHDRRFFDSLSSVYEDVLHLYTEMGDRYDRETLILYEHIVQEGPYNYISADGAHIAVEPGDVVIDAGAWIGDFSAYAAIKGAQVFAFEPSLDALRYLRQTAEMNGNIEVVPFGLSNMIEKMRLMENAETSSADKFMVGSEGEGLETITLDFFCQERGIERVDFIKADIEGFERLMLEGAKDVLKTFGPKLAICTYHLPDDPYVLTKLIMDANPNYRIYQGKAKLFAVIR